MQISTPAIIIKRYKIGEADRLLLTFSHVRGKILIVAKAVRRPQSKLAGHIEPYILTDLELCEGKGGYFHLISAYHSARDCRQNLSIENLRHLDILGETLDLALGEEQPNPPAFAIFCQGIEQIRQNPPNSYLTSIETLVKLLECLGFRPELNLCSICHQTVADQPVGWSSQNGGLVCYRCRQSLPEIKPVNDQKTIVLLRLMQTENNLAGRVKANKQQITESFDLVRDYLLTHLPRPLKTFS